MLTKRASASRSSGVGSAVGSPSVSALSPAFLTSPLKPAGRRECEVLGTRGLTHPPRLMLPGGPMRFSGLVMRQGLMVHHGAALCTVWHPETALGGGLMLHQGWTWHWGLILRQGVACCCDATDLYCPGDQCCLGTITSPWASAAPRINASPCTDTALKSEQCPSALTTCLGTPACHASPRHTLPRAALVIKPWLINAQLQLVPP